MLCRGARGRCCWQPSRCVFVAAVVKTGMCLQLLLRAAIAVRACVCNRLYAQLGPIAAFASSLLVVQACLCLLMPTLTGCGVVLLTAADSSQLLFCAATDGGAPDQLFVCLFWAALLCGIVVLRPVTAMQAAAAGNVASWLSVWLVSSIVMDN